MTRKSVRAIYCDDIRTEVQGKLSYMGVYTAQMLFGSFPNILQKLCVNVEVSVPYEERPKKSLHVRLFSGEQTLAEINLDEAALAGAPVPDPDPDEPEEDRRLVLGIGFIIAPVQIPGPMKIRLRAFVDGEELKGNALKIRLATDQERANLALS